MLCFEYQIVVFVKRPESSRLAISRQKIRSVQPGSVPIPILLRVKSPHLGMEIIGPSHLKILNRKFGYEIFRLRRLGHRFGLLLYHVF